MLGVMARRAVASIIVRQEPVYPAGRLDAVRVNGNTFIFMRDTGTRHANLQLPIPVNLGQPPAEPGLSRTQSRTWFLYRGLGEAVFFTADYITSPANLRIPTAAEDPDGNYRRVYDQSIENYVLEVVDGQIVSKTLTGAQDYLVGARGTSPGPIDTYILQTQEGHKVLTGLMIDGVPFEGTGQAVGETIQGIANYPAAEVVASVGAFDLKIRHAGSVSQAQRPTDAGDVIVTNGVERVITQQGGASFEDLGRPATEEEVSVNAEVTF